MSVHDSTTKLFSVAGWSSSSESPNYGRTTNFCKVLNEQMKGQGLSREDRKMICENESAGECETKNNKCVKAKGVRNIDPYAAIDYGDYDVESVCQGVNQSMKNQGYSPSEKKAICDTESAGACIMKKKGAVSVCAPRVKPRRNDAYSNDLGAILKSSLDAASMMPYFGASPSGLELNSLNYSTPLYVDGTYGPSPFSDENIYDWVFESAPFKKAQKRGSITKNLAKEIFQSFKHSQRQSLINSDAEDMGISDINAAEKEAINFIKEIIGDAPDTYINEPFQGEMLYPATMMKRTAVSYGLGQRYDNIQVNTVSEKLAKALLMIGAINEMEFIVLKSKDEEFTTQIYDSFTNKQNELVKKTLTNRKEEILAEKNKDKKDDKPAEKASEPEKPKDPTKDAVLSSFSI